MHPSLFTGTLAYATPPRFKPRDGRVILEPPGEGYGYWAGAPSAVYDPVDDRFFVYYRLRSPQTKGRGSECGIAVSDGGEAFTSIWTARKADLEANNLEKGGLIRDPHTGRWRLYLSYEVGRDGDQVRSTSRIDVIEAETPEAFDPLDARTVIDGRSFGFMSAKDPTLIVVGGEYFLFASVFKPASHQEREADGLVGLQTRTCTALFRSHDGLRFTTAKTILEPTGHGWDAVQRRMTSVFYLPPVWIGLYNGSDNQADSDGEYCGIATSFDLERWRCSTLSQPWLVSPDEGGSIRYVNALPVGDQMHYFYEYARADRGHELRHSVVPLA